jgi:hypothetical protein
MPLQPVAVTTDELAKNVARQILNQINSIKNNVVKLRAEGVPARPAVAERVSEDGRVFPAIPAVPAIPAAAIDAALGAENCALLDGIKDAIG